MSEIYTLLRRYGIEPRKELSQHFLVDQGALNRIVAAAELTAGQRVLEIGAGPGTLTRALLNAGACVTAVELDRALLRVLEQELGQHPRLRIVSGDILSLEAGELMDGEPYAVVANLPYAITSAVLRHLLEASLPPQRMVLMVQREVAERIVARDGRMSLLAVSVHFYGQPRLVMRLKPAAFYPPPQVESAVIRIDLRPPPLPLQQREDFFRLVRAGFAQPRKQLRNSLAAGLGIEPQEAVRALEKAQIDPRLRAERLSVADWVRLSQAIPLSAQADLTRQEDFQERRIPC